VRSQTALPSVQRLTNLYVTAGASNVLNLFNPSIPYTGAWIDLALVSSGTGSALYINGVSKATGSSLSSWFNSSTVLRIGAPTFSFFGSGSTSTQMLVASVALYNRALSASELQARYLNPYGFLTWPEDRRYYPVGVAAGGATSYSFPTKSWNWNHQAPSQAFSIASSQKSWQWHGQSPATQLSLTAAQKPWRWSPQAPVQSLGITPTQKAWQWSRNAPVLAQAIVAATKAWTWAAGATIAGGNISAASVLRYIGAFRRRRSQTADVKEHSERSKTGPACYPRGRAVLPRRT
jgi:hypothetical protein